MARRTKDQTFIAPLAGVRALARAPAPARNPGSILHPTIMILLLAAAACSAPGNAPDRDPTRPSSPTAPAPLLLRLEVPGEVRAREPVPMRLVLENHGDQPVEVGLGGAPIAFDFIVLDPDGQEVWSRLEGLAVEAILRPQTVGPGEAVDFLDAWDQRDNRGRRVAPGSYRVRGVLPVVGEPRGWGTETQVVRIEP